MSQSVGYPLTFTVDALLFTAGFIGVFGLPRLPPLSNVARPGLRSLRDGVGFLKNAPNIRMTFIVDLLAMSLGRPYVLFPALGATVIGGGSITVGILTAAAAIGTFLASLFSGPVAGVHHHGAAIGRSIAIYGWCTAAFGVVVLVMQSGFVPTGGPSVAEVAWPALVLAALALAGAGASDEISSIFRTTMLLVAAPDEVRGRMQGVFTVVVTGGPRIGDLLAGSAATAVALWFPPLIGGIAIALVIGVILRLNSGFRNYDSRTPQP